jgi:predicted amidophosphoribosyltransferase
VLTDSKITLRHNEEDTNKRSILLIDALKYADLAFNSVLSSNNIGFSNFIISQIVRSLTIAYYHSRSEDQQIIANIMRKYINRFDENVQIIEKEKKEAITLFNAGYLWEKIADEFNESFDKKIFLEKAQECTEASIPKFYQVGNFDFFHRAQDCKAAIDEKLKENEKILSEKRKDERVVQQIPSAHVILCPSCGNPRRPGSKFCGKCGSSTVLQSDTAGKLHKLEPFCLSCGEPLKTAVKYCGKCGASALQPPFQTASQPNQSRCSNCGTPLEKGTRFCAQCGNQL